MKLIHALTASVALFFATPAHANHYMQTADPYVVQQLNEIIWALGAACQMGNGQACSMMQLAQTEAHAMLNAGFECQMNGDQNACMHYNQAYGQLQQGYQQMQAAVQAGRLNAGGGGYSQSTHAERMQQIHNWGQQRLQWGQQQMQRSEANHQQFLEMLRQ